MQMKLWSHHAEPRFELHKFAADLLHHDHLISRFAQITLRLIAFRKEIELNWIEKFAQQKLHFFNQKLNIG